MGFVRREDGSVSVLFIILLPLVMFVAGMAIDFTALNHQRRYVQGQADVGALSGIRHFVSATAIRDAARRSVAENPAYDTVPISDQRIEIGTFLAGQFTPNADQAEIGSANAVRVTVRSPASLMVLSMFVDDENANVVRSAVAVVEPRVSFGLGNCLLNVKLLSPALRPLIGGTVDVLCSGRGVDAELDVAGFLGGLSLRAAALTPSGQMGTYGDILDAEYAASDVLEQALGVVVVPSRQPIRLAEVIYMPEDLRRLQVGSPLPPITLQASQVVLATAAVLQERIVDATVAVNLGSFANLAAKVTVSDPPVIVIGARPGDPQAVARTAQIRVELPTLTIANIFSLSLAAEVAHASARLSGQGQTCSQTPTAPVAVFDPVTAGLLRLDIGVKVLGLPVPLAGVASKAASLVQTANTKVTFEYRDYISQTPRSFGPKTPQAVDQLSALARTTTAELLTSAKTAIQGAQSAPPACSGLLGCTVSGVVNPVTATVNAVLSSLGASIPNVAQAAGTEGRLVDAVLDDLLGLGIAQAELQLIDIDCANGARLGF